MIIALTEISHASSSTRKLFDMLATCRPHGSRGEHDFITRFLLPYGVDSDGFGNLWLRIGDAPLLWSSHVDTCHRRDGLQKVQLDETGLVRLADGSPSNCLGADCTAGVWLMTEMIEAGVPGLYVFHRGEERGGLGSSYVAANEASRLDGMLSAVAFDRRGTRSVITHQRGERCCSDVFATSLATLFNLDHAIDPTGLFTDTANYVDLVGECSNLSIGYSHEHTVDETLDIGYLLRLRDRVVAADFSALTFERQPGDCEPDFYETWDFGRPFNEKAHARHRMVDIVRDYPHAVADFLELDGVSTAELLDFIRGDIPF